MCAIRMAKVESALRLALELIEAFNVRDLGRIGSILDSECLYRTAGPAPDGETIRGASRTLERLKSELQKHVALQVEEILGFGRACLVLWVCTWGGGPEARLRGACLVKEKGDRIVEIASYVKGLPGGPSA